MHKTALKTTEASGKKIFAFGGTDPTRPVSHEPQRMDYSRKKFTEMKNRFTNVRKRNLQVANALAQVNTGVDMFVNDTT